MALEITDLESLERCPLCGGTSGFHYQVKIIGTQFKGWSKEGLRDECMSDFQVDESKTTNTIPVCEDCGKRLK